MQAQNIDYTNSAISNKIAQSTNKNFDQRKDNEINDNSLTMLNFAFSDFKTNKFSPFSSSKKPNNVKNSNHAEDIYVKKSKIHEFHHPYQREINMQF